MMLFGILISLAGGIFLSYSGLMPSALQPFFDKAPFYCLCVMLILVGYGIGKDRQAMRTLLNQNLKMLLIPLGTVMGAFIGGVAAVFFLNLGLQECLAVASGLGWYSFTAVYLTEVHSAELGSIAFLANVFREIAGLFLIPLVVRIAGSTPAISIAGATSMDSAMPVVIKYAGSNAAVTSFIHGVALSVAVPFLVGIIMSF